MPQHLVQPTPLHANASEDYIAMVGQGNGLNFRHLLQLPLKLTPSARHLPVLPLCTEAFGITVRGITVITESAIALNV
jgi:hypothetical protein